MPKFKSYDFNQTSMVVINYRDQLQPDIIGAFAVGVFNTFAAGYALDVIFGWRVLLQALQLVWLCICCFDLDKPWGLTSLSGRRTCAQSSDSKELADMQLPYLEMRRQPHSQSHHALQRKALPPH